MTARRAPQRGKMGTTLGPTFLDKQAKLGRLEMDRLMRRILPRCQCRHGIRVHTKDGCLVDSCSCTQFKES